MSIRKWKSWHIVWIWLSRSVLNLESWRQRCGKLLRIQTIYVCFCLLDLWVGFTSSLDAWLLSLFFLFIAWKRLENLRKSTMPTRFQRPCLLSWTFKFKNWIFFFRIYVICLAFCFILDLKKSMWLSNQVLFPFRRGKYNKNWTWLFLVYIYMGLYSNSQLKGIGWPRYRLY